MIDSEVKQGVKLDNYRPAIKKEELLDCIDSVGGSAKCIELCIFCRVTSCITTAAGCRNQQKHGTWKSGD